MAASKEMIPAVRRDAKALLGKWFRRVMKQGRWTPWFYLLPALIVMFVFIVFPAINTFFLSFQNATGNAPATQTCSAERHVGEFSRIIAMR